VKSKNTSRALIPVISLKNNIHCVFPANFLLNSIHPLKEDIVRP
jgi:hypothetical protein